MTILTTTGPRDSWRSKTSLKLKQIIICLRAKTPIGLNPRKGSETTSSYRSCQITSAILLKMSLDPILKGLALKDSWCRPMLSVLWAQQNQMGTIITRRRRSIPNRFRNATDQQLSVKSRKGELIGSSLWIYFHNLIEFPIRKMQVTTKLKNIKLRLLNIFPTFF